MSLQALLHQPRRGARGRASARSTSSRLDGLRPAPSRQALAQQTRACRRELAVSAVAASGARHALLHQRAEPRRRRRAAGRRARRCRRPPRRSACSASACVGMSPTKSARMPNSLRKSGSPCQRASCAQRSPTSTTLTSTGTGSGSSGARHAEQTRTGAADVEHAVLQRALQRHPRRRAPPSSLAACTTRNPPSAAAGCRRGSWTRRRGSSIGPSWTRSIDPARFCRRREPLLDHRRAGERPCGRRRRSPGSARDGGRGAPSRRPPESASSTTAATASARSRPGTGRARGRARGAPMSPSSSSASERAAPATSSRTSRREPRCRSRDARPRSRARSAPSASRRACSAAASSGESAARSLLERHRLAVLDRQRPRGASAGPPRRCTSAKPSASMRAPAGRRPRAPPRRRSACPAPRAARDSSRSSSSVGSALRQDPAQLVELARRARRRRPAGRVSSRGRSGCAEPRARTRGRAAPAASARGARAVARDGGAAAGAGDPRRRRRGEPGERIARPSSSAVDGALLAHGSARARRPRRWSRSRTQSAPHVKRRSAGATARSGRRSASRRHASAAVVAPSG